MKWLAIQMVVLLLAIPSSPPPLPAEPMAGATQELLRLNPTLNTGKPAYTATDCFESEPCLPHLVQEVSAAGGHIGTLAKSLGHASPDLSGENYSYSFEPAAGKSFCKAVLLKLSIAPSFGAGSPEFVLSVSRHSAKAVVRLPKPERSSAKVWFDGILILVSVTDPDRVRCTLGNEMRKTECKGGKCETIRF
jgi:hypothetical protein